MFLALSLSSVFLASPALAQLGPQKVLTVLATHDLTQVQLVRSYITERGGRVRAVLGIHGLIADIEPSSAADLARLPGVEGVYSGNVAPDRFRDPNARRLAEVWNLVLLGEPPAAPFPGPGPAIDVHESPAELLSADERAQEIAEYRDEWERISESLPLELDGPGCHLNGAGYYDTSLYLAGDVAVGVFYTTGSAGAYTAAMTAATFADIIIGLDYFINDQPTANLTFVYQSEVDGSGLPLAQPTNQQSYVNTLRNIYCTDWAYMITVQNGGLWPNANLHGPSMRLDRTFGWFHYTVRHETGHVFGAMDQYSGSGGMPTQLWGYLQAVHANACNSNGLGYFGGFGECLDDMMSGWPYNDFIGAYSAGQFGWHDNNGDGRLDVMHTFPDVVAGSVTHSATNPVTYFGTAIDRPLLNELTSSLYTDVSINWVTGVQYRVNGGSAWIEAAPTDGIWDSNTEGFMFTLPGLPNGTYIIDIRAMNSTGHIENSIFTQSLVITGSSTTNTRPFATLSVSPARAQTGTTITANATGSKDLETSAGLLQYSYDWGFGWSVYGSSPTATHVYSVPGTYWVQVRVRDAGGVFHVVAKPVVIESYNTAPIAAFTTVPENRHFASSAVYTVTLNANAVRDGETPTSALQVRWDADGDGLWDAPWTTTKTRNASLTNPQYPKTDRRRIRMEVMDAAGNITGATRWIWLVPYNHRPTLPFMNPVTFVAAGPNYTMTVNASDADFSTTWDGFLEYRYDYENDGTYDTEFTTTSSFLLPGQYRYTVRVEVRDRFHARVGWAPPVILEEERR
jgi:hypothetical protein